MWTTLHADRAKSPSLESIIVTAVEQKDEEPLSYYHLSCDQAEPSTQQQSGFCAKGEENIIPIINSIKADCSAYY